MKPVITIDKSVGKHPTAKSVCIQYDPLYALSKLETDEPHKNCLKVKWPTSKWRENVENTDFTSQKYNLF